MTDPGSPRPADATANPDARGQGGDRIERLLEPLIELDASDRDAALQSLCDEHPDLASELRDRFEIWQTLLGSDEHAASAPSHVEPVRFGADYELLEPLGSGGMGVVWLARQRKGGVERLVALKMIRDRALFSAEARERFRREAQAALRVEHPGLCPIYDVGEHDGTPYLAMRRVPGRSLAEHLDDARRDGHTLALRESTATEGEPAASQSSSRSSSGSSSSSRSSSRRRVDSVLRFLEGAARALHVAHEAGLVHRDVKPGNLMVTPNGDPVVLDFGLVRQLDDDSADLTVTGQTLGTPSYMAPEQIEPRGRAPDRTTDIYALGATLFECLTLRPPFTAESRDGLYLKILQEPAPRLQRATRGLPRDLSVVVETALRKEPGRRYATALEFAEDLRRVRELQPILARPTSSLVRAGLWTRRNPVVSVVLVLLAIASSLLALQVRETTREAQRTREARDLAQRQSVLAGRAKDQAERSLADARDALDALVWTARDRLVDVSGSIPVRKELLRIAIGFHERMLKRHAEDPAMRLELAKSTIARGQMLLDLGRSEAALEAIETGLELLDEAEASGVALQLVENERSNALSSMADLLSSTGRATDATELATRALEARKRAVDELPGTSHNTIVALSNNYRLLAIRSREIGDDDAAIDNIERALAILDSELPGNQTGHDPTFPRSLSADSSRAACWTELGRIYRDRGEIETAEAANSKALEAYRRLAAEPNARRRDRNGLATGLINQALLFANSGRADRACTLYREAIEVLEALLRDFPGQSLYARNLATTWNNLYSALRKAGKNDAARDALRRAVEVHSERIANGEADEKTRLQLARLAYNLGNADRRDLGLTVAAGHYRRAIDALQPLVDEDVASLDTRRLLIRALQNLAVCLAIENEPRRADEVFGRALELALASADKFPLNLAAAADVALLQHNLSIRATERGDYDTARGLMDAAYEGRTQLIAKSPQSTSLLRDMLISGASRLRLLETSERGPHARAVIERFENHSAPQARAAVLRSSRGRTELARLFEADAEAAESAGELGTARARRKRALLLLEGALTASKISVGTRVAWLSALTGCALHPRSSPEPGTELGPKLLDAMRALVDDEGQLLSSDVLIGRDLVGVAQRLEAVDEATLAGLGIAAADFDDAMQPLR